MNSSSFILFLWVGGLIEMKANSAPNLGRGLGLSLATMDRRTKRPTNKPSYRISWKPLKFWKIKPIRNSSEMFPAKRSSLSLWQLNFYFWLNFTDQKLDKSGHTFYCLSKAVKFTWNNVMIICCHKWMVLTLSWEFRHLDINKRCLENWL